MIAFTVPGLPIAQPRQRHRVVTPKGEKPYAQNYTPEDDPVNDYKRAVQIEARKVYRGEPLTCPVKVMLVFRMPRPGRLRWKTRPMPRCPCPSKPDWDNLSKAVCDALTGVIWRDDSQLVDVRVVKQYAAGGEEPATLVGVEEIS